MTSLTSLGLPDNLSPPLTSLGPGPRYPETEPDHMDGRDGVQSLLVLRKLTRAITDAVRVQMTEYLKALAPLLRPKAILGDYVLGGSKEPSRKSDKAFADLQKLYETVALAKPYNLPRELTPPLSFSSVGLEITPLDYYHVAQS